MNGPRTREEAYLAAPDQVRRIRAILALSGVPTSALDDGLQQVRLKLLEQASDPARTVRNPDAWAAVTASRVAMDWHRTATRDVSLRSRLLDRWSSPAPESSLENDRVRALAVAEGLESLTKEQREVVVLRFYADLQVDDIAEAQGVPSGTVKSRLHKALAVLRTALRDDEEFEHDHV